MPSAVRYINLGGTVPVEDAGEVEEDQGELEATGTEILQFFFCL